MSGRYIQPCTFILYVEWCRHNGCSDPTVDEFQRLSITSRRKVALEAARSCVFNSVQDAARYYSEDHTNPVKWRTLLPWVKEHVRLEAINIVGE